MLASIIRNSRNASRTASIGFNLGREGSDALEPIFEHKATALDIHNLAGKGHRDLLRQTKQSSLPLRRGETFHDIAWAVAVSSLVKDAPRLRTCGPGAYGLSLCYLALLTEYKGLDWANGESRDINVAHNGDVDIYWIGENLRSDYLKLGNFKRS